MCLEGFDCSGCLVCLEASETLFFQVCFDGMFAASDDLPSVYYACRDEVYAALNPQGAVFPFHIMKLCSHGVYSHKSVYAECRREYV